MDGWLLKHLLRASDKGPECQSQKERRKARTQLLKLFRKLLHHCHQSRSHSYLVENSRDLEAREENVYERTRLPPKGEGQWILFQPYGAQCPACLFGDRDLTCTCAFRTQAGPDFKLYEEESLYSRSDPDETLWI